MSSNIRVQKICNYCNNEFTAKTTVTKYCSNNCSKNAWRKRKQKKKIKAINRSTKKSLITIDLNNKEFLTVSELAILLNCSKRTVYRSINNETIKAFNIGQRLIRIKRTEIDKLFTL